LPVIFCLDRAGLVGADGATHHGVFDLAYLRIIPNMTIAAPMNEVELRNMMYTAQKQPKGPFAIRYPRGRGVLTQWQLPFEEIPVGRGRTVKEGADIAILSIGHIGNMVTEAIELAEHEQYSIAHYDMRFVKPLDEQLLHTVFKRFSAVITIEDGIIKGGFGSAVLEFMNDNGYHAMIKRLGVPDNFIDHGTQEELYAECGIEQNSIYNTIKEILSKKVLSNAG